MSNRNLISFLRVFEKDSVIESVITPIIGLVVGLLIVAIIILLEGVNPITAYQELIFGAIGTKINLFSTLLKFIPLSFTGLAVTLAYRAGVFNIGAEGQLYIGALVATWVAIKVNLPFYLPSLLALISGMIVGGFFAFIPAYLKVEKGINEVLTTILMNYVGINIVGFSVNSFLMEKGQTAPQSPLIERSAHLPIIAKLEGIHLHIGIVLVFVIAFLMYDIFWNTTWGFEIRSVSINIEASKYGGINAKKVIMIVMFVSGAIASLAGSTEVLGVQYRLMENFMTGYGYDGITVALLGGLNPLGVLAAAFFLGALRNGAYSMQIATGIPISIIYVVQALAILSIISASALYKKFLAEN
ncbi:MAG: ABC transporter permease [Thermoanaerobacter sp.]|nr:ABC transporter permease [Thermoanaerobacter sp.]